jgi:tetratricopeptide (TPR) repeat protein
LSYLQEFIAHFGGRRRFRKRTTAVVYQNLIKRITLTKQCSFATFLKLKGNLKDVVQPANYFISHVWNYNFIEMIEAIIDHFQQQHQNESLEHIYLWIDVFSFNHHKAAIYNPYFWDKDGDTGFERDSSYQSFHFSNSSSHKKVDYSFSSATGTAAAATTAGPVHSQDEKDPTLQRTMMLNSSSAMGAADLLEDQSQKKLTGQFANLIKEIGHTVLVLTSWKQPLPFTRLWCMYELYLTIQAGNSFDIALTNKEINVFLTDLFETHERVISHIIRSVDVYNSKSLFPQDSNVIINMLRHKKINFDSMNHSVTTLMHNWLVNTSDNFIHYSDSYEFMKLHVDKAYEIYFISALLFKSNYTFVDAEKILLKGYEKAMARLTPTSPITLSFIDKLIEVYNLQEKYVESINMSILLYQKMKDIYGEDSRETADSLYNLAVLYTKLSATFPTPMSSAVTSPNPGTANSNNKGMFSPTTPQSPPIFLPQNHAPASPFSSLPTTGNNNNNNVSSGNVTSNKYSLALEYCIICYDKYVKLYGFDSLETIHVKHCLAIIYQNLGKYEQAEVTLNYCLKKYKFYLGKMHPSTLLCQNYLALNYLKQKRFDEAEELFLETFEKQKDILGLKHPNSILILNNLIHFYQEQHNTLEIVKYYHLLYETVKEIYGFHHPKTMQIRNDLWQFVKQSSAQVSPQTLEKMTKISPLQSPPPNSSKNHKNDDEKHFPQQEDRRQLQLFHPKDV